MSSPGYLSLADKTSQSIPPNTWTALVIEGASQWDLPEGPTVLNAQLYSSPPAVGRAKRALVRFVRHLADGTTDATAQETYAVPASGAFSVSSTNITFTDPGVPIGVEVFHDGSVPLVLTTRIFKALTPAEYVARRILAAV